ncbi:MAG TPA: ABC transporter permease [Vicinamibacterales bacterium]|nr:ABC transporter permease [Vicinamibacterales bacterium]
MSIALTDLRLAARRLAATPFFTIFAVLSLAVGVGVTTAVYSVVDSVFLKAPGIRNPEAVAFIVTPADAGLLIRGSISQPDFADLRAAQSPFSSVSASATFYPAVTSSLTTETLTAEAVDGAYFSTLGVSAEIGRSIQPADDADGRRVVVLSHRLWRARFAADHAVVGQTARISGHTFEVIGVAPATFEGAIGGLSGTSLWIPLSAEASLAPPTTTLPRERRRLLVFGRLKPSVTMPTAAAAVATIAANLDASFPPRSRAGETKASERPWLARSAAEVTQADNLFRRFGLTLVALVGLVLAVACTNLANLVLARSTIRQQELAVRSALGASRWRLVREQLAESVLLAVGGAVASYLVFQGLRAAVDADFQIGLPMGGRWQLSIHPSLDASALAVAVIALLVSLTVFGLEPALRLTRSRDVRSALGGGKGSLAVPGAGRRRVLLRWQVAISAGFFIVATMFVRLTITEAQHEPGVQMDRLGVASLQLPAHQWGEERVRQTMARIQQEARNDPNVEAVSVSTGLPFGIRGPMRLVLSTPDNPALKSELERSTPTATGIAATPSIFTTLGVTMVRGRGFDDRDHAAAAPVVVLSDFTARRIFGASDPIGQKLVIQRRPSRGDPPATATVIGIARDTDVGRLFGDPRMFVYLPFAQRYDSLLTVAVRSTGDANLAARAAQAAIRRADPDLAIDLTGTARTILAGPFVVLRAAGIAALALGGLTLLLAMGGLFGIQSHTVSHRTPEIGVRMAFGATAGQIQRMVLKDGYRPVLEGLALGLFIGVAGRTIVRAYLEVDISVVDPWTLLVALPLIGSAFCACYYPAHRAARVDPNVALRHL